MKLLTGIEKFYPGFGVQLHLYFPVPVSQIHYNYVSKCSIIENHIITLEDVEGEVTGDLVDLYLKKILVQATLSHLLLIGFQPGKWSILMGLYPCLPLYYTVSFKLAFQCKQFHMVCIGAIYMRLFLRPPCLYGTESHGLDSITTITKIHPKMYVSFWGCNTCIKAGSLPKICLKNRHDHLTKRRGGYRVTAVGNSTTR